MKHKPSIVLGTIGFSLSGVNSFNENLCEGFNKKGYDCVILSTSPENQPATFQAIHTNRVFLDTSGVATWRGRWHRLHEFLKHHRPCVYIPNHDEAYSACSPSLNKNIFVVGVIHSDEDYHYRHLGRMGDAWNACVCVSRTIRTEATRRYPHLAHKLVTIPNAVAVPAEMPLRKDSNEFRLIYAGRLDQNQKRVFDLVRIALQLSMLAVPFRFSIVGEGRDSDKLKALVKQHDLESCIEFLGMKPYEEVLGLFETHDVVLLTSDFEGTPMAILEAMARGCVPVTTTVRSGLSDLIVNGKNGFVFQPGEVEVAAAKIKLLSDDSEVLHNMREAAWHSLSAGPHNRDHQIQAYISLFDIIMGKEVRFCRTRGGPSRPPEHIDASWKNEFRSILVKLFRPSVFR